MVAAGPAGGVEMRRNNLCVALALLTLASFGAAQAGLIAYDGLGYTVPNPIANASNNGGTGSWQTGWFQLYVSGTPSYATGQSADMTADVFSGSTATPFATTGDSLGHAGHTSYGTREFATTGSSDAFNVAASGPADALYASFLFRRADTVALNLGYPAAGGQEALSARFGANGQVRLFSGGGFLAASGAQSWDPNTDYFGLVRLTSAENSLDVNISATFFTSAAAIPADEGSVTWLVNATSTWPADQSFILGRIQAECGRGRSRRDPRGHGLRQRGRDPRAGGDRPRRARRGPDAAAPPPLSGQAEA